MAVLRETPTKGKLKELLTYLLALAESYRDNTPPPKFADYSLSVLENILVRFSGYTSLFEVKQNIQAIIVRLEAMWAAPDQEEIAGELTKLSQVLDEVLKEEVPQRKPYQEVLDELNFRLEELKRTAPQLNFETLPPVRGFRDLEPFLGRKVAKESYQKVQRAQVLEGLKELLNLPDADSKIKDTLGQTLQRAFPNLTPEQLEKVQTLSFQILQTRLLENPRLLQLGAQDLTRWLSSSSFRALVYGLSLQKETVHLLDEADFETKITLASQNLARSVLPAVPTYFKISRGFATGVLPEKEDLAQKLFAEQFLAFSEKKGVTGFFSYLLPSGKNYLAQAVRTPFILPIGLGLSLAPEFFIKRWPGITDAFRGLTRGGLLAFRERLLASGFSETSEEIGELNKRISGLSSFESRHPHLAHSFQNYAALKLESARASGRAPELQTWLSLKSDLPEFYPQDFNPVSTLKSRLGLLGGLGRAAPIVNVINLVAPHARRILKYGALGLAALYLILASLGPGALAGGAVGGLAGGVAGAYFGAKAGAALGATIGSVIPGVGTAVGGIAGGILGGMIGFFVGAGTGAVIGGAIGWGLEWVWKKTGEILGSWGEGIGNFLPGIGPTLKGWFSTISSGAQVFGAGLVSQATALLGGFGSLTVGLLTGGLNAAFTIASSLASGLASLAATVPAALATTVVGVSLLSVVTLAIITMTNIGSALVQKPVGAGPGAPGGGIGLDPSFGGSEELRKLFLAAASWTKMPAGVLAGVAKIEGPHLFSYSNRQILDYGAPGAEDPINKTPNECGAVGPMQFLTGAANPAKCPQAVGVNIWETWKNAVNEATGENRSPKPQNIKDSIYAAAKKLKTDSKTTPDERVWNKEAVYKAAGAYYGACEIKGDGSYCELVWQYYLAYSQYEVISPSGWFFSQIDSRWSSYGKDSVCNIGTSGCGPTSMAMVLKYFGVNTNPIEMWNKFVERGFMTRDTCLTVWQAIISIPGEYGLNSIGLGTDWNQAKQHLGTGHLIIASTNLYDGHLLVITKVDGNQVTTNDPALLDGEGKVYNMASVRWLQFWAIWK